MASLESILRQAGFTGQGLQTAMAVAMAESGGNARAYNPKGRDLSYGLFQINMLGGMGPERRKKYGLASNEALFDPVTNARVAYAMSNGGKNWKPWTTYTSGKYRTYLGKGAEVAGGAAATGTAAGGTGEQPLSMDALAARYGYSLAFFKQDPTLWKLINQAVKDQMTPDEFGAQLKNTQWYKKHSESDRQWRALERVDPETARARMHQTKVRLIQMGQQMGVHVDPKRLADMAWRVNAYGWDENQVASAFQAEMKFDPKKVDQYRGMVAVNAASIKEQAADYGVKIDDKTAFTLTTQLIGRSTTEEGITEYIKKQAKIKYAGLSDDIDAGMTVKDYASPFVQTQAKLLEVDPADVHLDDPRIAAALQHRDPKTNKPAAMSLTDFEKSVKSDGRWMKTKNARDELMDGTRQILTDWGLG
jgi:hypothetical protein